MARALLLLTVLAVSACGVETATTAATGAAIKKSEVEQGQKTLDQSRQRVEQAAQQIQQRAEQGRESSDK